MKHFFISLVFPIALREFLLEFNFSSNFLQYHLTVSLKLINVFSNYCTISLIPDLEIYKTEH